MLTATYSLITISAEQKKARNILVRLQECVRHCLKTLQEMNFGTVESAVHQFVKFEHYCHSRKVEMYVFPAVRGLNYAIDSVLSELEAMSAYSVDLLHSVQSQLDGALEQGITKVIELCRALEIYCEHFFHRLEKEEEELLPMIGRTLTLDDWFPIASQFLSDEAIQPRRHKTVFQLT
jgi:hemerythrin-like domain-containing protein